MHPIHEILEAKLKSSRWFQKACNKVQVAECIGFHGIRILAVVALAVLASFIPGFGSFISFVGSTLCALLSFVLPASFHLTFLGSSMVSWQRMLDYCILLVGLVFAVYGTYDAILGHSIDSWYDFLGQRRSQPRLICSWLDSIEWSHRWQDKQLLAGCWHVSCLPGITFMTLVM